MGEEGDVFLPRDVDSLVSCHEDRELFAVAGDREEVVPRVEVEVHDYALELHLQVFDLLLLVHDGVIDSQPAIDAAHHQVLSVGR